MYHRLRWGILRSFIYGLGRRPYMQVVRDFSRLSYPQGCIVLLGTFDGLHAGHIEIVNKAIAMGNERSLPVVVLTFWPLPKVYFKHIQHPFMRLSDKLHLLRGKGVNAVWVMRFSRSLAELSAINFINDVLVNDLNAKFVLIGEDFRFGKAREGDVCFLHDAGRDRSFETVTVPMERRDSMVVSSTELRKAADEGKIERVEMLLGRKWTLAGRVRRQNEREGVLLMNRCFPQGPAFLETALGAFDVELKIEKYQETKTDRRLCCALDDSVPADEARRETKLWASWPATNPSLCGQKIIVALSPAHSV